MRHAISYPVLLVASAFHSAAAQSGGCHAEPIQLPDPNCTLAWYEEYPDDDQAARVKCYLQCLEQGYDLVPDHATNTRTGACSVPRPGKEPYEAGCYTYGMFLKCDKKLTEFPNACGSYIEMGDTNTKLYVAFYAFGEPAGDHKTERALETRVVAGNSICAARYKMVKGDCFGGVDPLVNGPPVAPPVPPEPIPKQPMPIPFPILDENGETATTTTTAATATTATAATTATTVVTTSDPTGTTASPAPTPKSKSVLFDRRTVLTVLVVLCVGALAFAASCCRQRARQQQTFRDPPEIEVGYMPGASLR